MMKVIGTVVSDDEFETLCEKLGDVAPSDAIEWFIYQVINDVIHLEKDGEE